MTAMQTFRVKPDQWTAVGESLRLAVTDIDAGGVRVLLRGRIIGGPDDGGPVDRAVEIALGSEVRVGLVTLTLIDTKAGLASGWAGGTAKLGIFCPPHLPIRTVKEST